MQIKILSCSIRNREFRAVVADVLRSGHGRGNYCEFGFGTGWYVAELHAIRDGAEIWRLYRINAPGEPRSRRGRAAVKSWSNFRREEHTNEKADNHTIPPRVMVAPPQ